MLSVNLEPGSFRFSNSGSRSNKNATSTLEERRQDRENYINNWTAITQFIKGPINYRNLIKSARANKRPREKLKIAQEAAPNSLPLRYYVT